MLQSWMLVVAQEHYQWMSYHQSLYQNITKMAHFIVFLNNLITGKCICKYGGNHLKIALRNQRSSRPTCWKGCILWSCNCKETHGGKRWLKINAMAHLELRLGRQKEHHSAWGSQFPTLLSAASHRPKEGKHRETVIITQGNSTLLGAPVSCFPYPAMLNLLHEGVWLLLPLPGNRWEKTLHMTDPGQVPGPKHLRAACLLDTFFFQFLLLILFHFRDSCFSLHAQKMN